MTAGVWWVWAVAALLLGCLEMVLPGFVLLGFGIGAACVALMLVAGGPLAGWIGSSLPLALVIFAVLSLVAWIALRQFIGRRDGQTKTFDHDVND